MKKHEGFDGTGRELVDQRPSTQVAAAYMVRAVETMPDVLDVDSQLGVVRTVSDGTMPIRDYLASCGNAQSALTPQPQVER